MNICAYLGIRQGGSLRFTQKNTYFVMQIVELVCIFVKTIDLFRNNIVIFSKEL